MKTLFLYIVSAVIISFCFSSCMENMRIEKRHYRNGFYFNGAHDRSPSADSTTQIADAVPAVEQKYERAAEGTAVTVSADTNMALSSTAAVVNDSVKYSLAPNEKTASENVAVDPQSAAPQSLQNDETPAEAKGLNTLSWIAAGALVLGVIAAIVAFLPYVSAGFGVLIAAAPFLIVAALVLGLVVMINARRRMESSGTAESRSYYDKLRKRGRLIVVLASAVIAVFILFLALVIAALSNFQ